MNVLDKKAPCDISSIVIFSTIPLSVWTVCMTRTSRPFILIKFWSLSKERNTQKEDLHSLILFHLFHELVKCSRAFEIKFSSKYNSLSLTFLCINRQTQDNYGPVGARGDYLERVAMLQVQGGMLITFVDSQDAASSFSFVLPLYGLINYETVCRWFIWEQEMFKPFFFLSHVHSSWGRLFIIW